MIVEVFEVEHKLRPDFTLIREAEAIIDCRSQLKLINSVRRIVRGANRVAKVRVASTLALNRREAVTD